LKTHNGHELTLFDDLPTAAKRDEAVATINKEIERANSYMEKIFMTKAEMKSAFEKLNNAIDHKLQLSNSTLETLQQKVVDPKATPLDADLQHCHDEVVNLSKQIHKAS